MNAIFADSIFLKCLAQGAYPNQFIQTLHNHCMTPDQLTSSP